MRDIDKLEPQTGAIGQPVFFVHDGLSSLALVNSIAALLGNDHSIYSLPFVDTRERELRTVQGMGLRLVKKIQTIQPSGPYRVVGVGLGGRLAYEVATQFLGENQNVGFLGMIDASFFSCAKNFCINENDTNIVVNILQGLRRGSGTTDIVLKKIKDSAVSVLAGESKIHSPAQETFAKPNLNDIQECMERLRRYETAFCKYFPGPIDIVTHLFSFPGNPAGIDLLSEWGSQLSPEKIRITSVIHPGDSTEMYEPVASLAKSLSDALQGQLEIPNIASGSQVSPIVPLTRSLATVGTLFCLPGAGGNVASFAALSDELCGMHAIYGIQPRGLFGEEVPYSTVAAAAEVYCHAVLEMGPTGAIHLLGHSFGGWVALELAQCLQSRGLAVASLTILDSSPPSNDRLLTEYDENEAITNLVQVFEQAAGCSLEISANEIRACNQAQITNLLHRQLVRVGLMPVRSTARDILGIVRTFASCLRTVYRPQSAFHGSANFLYLDDPDLDDSLNQREYERHASGWRNWAPALVVGRGQGNHMTVLKPPHVRMVAGWLLRNIVNSR